MNNFLEENGKTIKKYFLNIDKSEDLIKLLENPKQVKIDININNIKPMFPTVLFNIYECYYDKSIKDSYVVSINVLRYSLKNLKCVLDYCKKLEYLILIVYNLCNYDFFDLIYEYKNIKKLSITIINKDTKIYFGIIPSHITSLKIYGLKLEDHNISSIKQNTSLNIIKFEEIEFYKESIIECLKNKDIRRLSIPFEINKSINTKNIIDLEYFSSDFSSEVDFSSIKSLNMVLTNNNFSLLKNISKFNVKYIILIISSDIIQSILLLLKNINTLISLEMYWEVEDKRKEILNLNFIKELKNLKMLKLYRFKFNCEELLSDSLEELILINCKFLKDDDAKKIFYSNLKKLSILQIYNKDSNEIIF